jgi:hypothetical protein
MIGRNPLSQEVIFSPDETEEVVGALKEIIRDTDIGRDYKKNFYRSEDGDNHLEKIIGAAQLVAGGEMISLSSMTRALQLLISSGALQPRDFEPSPELSEPEPDTRPRTRDGKLMTESQQRWSEMTEWTNTHSMQEVNLRKRNDPQYAAFVRKAYAAEVTHEIPDAVTPVGEPTKSVKATPALIAFVEAYHRASVEDLKPKGGFVRLDGDVVSKTCS